MDVSELTTVDLGVGEPYHLRYSLGGVKRLKQKFGKSLFRGELLQVDEEYLPDIIHVGLVENKEALAKEFGLPHRPISLEELEERVELSRLPDILKAFAAAIQQAFPDRPSDPTKASLTAS